MRAAVVDGLVVGRVEGRARAGRVVAGGAQAGEGGILAVDRDGVVLVVDRGGVGEGRGHHTGVDGAGCCASRGARWGGWVRAKRGETRRRGRGRRGARGGWGESRGRSRVSWTRV